MSQAAAFAQFQSESCSFHSEMIRGAPDRKIFVQRDNRTGLIEPTGDRTRLNARLQNQGFGIDNDAIAVARLSISMPPKTAKL